MSPEEEYAQLGELIATLPNFGSRLLVQPLGDMELRWYGRLHAILERRTASIEAMQVAAAWSNLGSVSHDRAVRDIQALLYAALARSEQNLPVHARGAFIGAGNRFDALAVIGRVLRQTTGSLLIVDPYLNEVFLTEFAPMVPSGVEIRLLSQRKGADGSLLPAVARWQQQFGNQRPLEARYAGQGTLHDRMLIDQNSVFFLSQSFNAFAARSPASLLRVEPDVANMKREAFEHIWEESAPIDQAS